MKKLKVKIDKELCIGCQSCSIICPEVFVMKGEKAETKVKETDIKSAKDAAESCPTKAITLS